MADLRIALQAALGDRYRLERELGRGGMATVYLGQDLRHDRPVALKVLHPELNAPPILNSASTAKPKKYFLENSEDVSASQTCSGVEAI